MLRLNCPFCGLRDHHEFAYLEDASVQMPSFEDTSVKAWFEAVFLRKNPRGIHVEHWHHIHGCRMILRVERNTQTHEIMKVEAAHPSLRQGLGDANAETKPSREAGTKT